MENLRRKLLSLSCCAILVAGTSGAQENQQFQLVVVRGASAQNNIKKGRATKAVVEVRDRNNKPVAGVILTFTMPRGGASGTFTGGEQIASVTTDPLGQASVTYQPNSVAGDFNIQVSGNHQGQALNTTISQTNIAAAAVSATTIGVIVGVAAAVGVGLGVGLTRGNDTPATASRGIRITPGTPTVGPPQ